MKYYNLNLIPLPSFVFVCVTAGAEGNGNEAGNDGNRAGENEQGADAAGVVAEDGNRLWLIVKEIQMIVFGFITSLLPGFHNID